MPLLKLWLCVLIGLEVFFNYDPKSYCPYPLNTIITLNVEKDTQQMVLEL